MSTAAPAARIDLLRHGQVSGGDGFRGWQDDPLHPNGWQQMWQAVGDCGPRPRWQRIVSSPLQRCAAFAQALAEQCQLPLQTDPRWRELSFGAWEGRSAADIQATDAKALQAFWRDPNGHPPPGGETLQTLQQRCGAAWDELVSGLVAGERLLLVAHAGVIRVLLCRMLGMSNDDMFRLEVPHAALISIIADPDYPRLELGHSRDWAGHWAD